jgi:hypothetical protein
MKIFHLQEYYNVGVFCFYQLLISVDHAFGFVLSKLLIDDFAYYIGQ